jgi:hypothetical protein
MTTRTHANARVDERLTLAGFDAQARDRVYQDAEHLAATSAFDSEAVCFLRLPAIVGQVWGAESNGDEVWAIIRQRRLVTVMLRRSTQPKSPDSLRVERVTVLA